MAAEKTYKARAIVLRKTKLGERDLVVTMLASTGELMRVVAKGARKPGGSFASKLELFSTVDIMAARGRTLDVVTDARFSDGAARPSFGLEQTACASAIAELLAVTCQEGLEQPRLFDMAREALRVLAQSDPADAVAVAAAALVKAVSFLGFRPNIDTCTDCGERIDIGPGAKPVLFGAAGGGAFCARCAPGNEGMPVDAATLAWTRALLAARFVDIAAMEIDPSASFSVLGPMDTWITVHAGKRLKSLAYLFTSGLW